MTPTSLPIEIGDKALTLTFNFGAMRLAEKELGQPIMSVFKKDEATGKAAVSFDALSALWWAALQRKHRMTRDATDGLVDEAGLEKVSEWLTEGLGGYFGVGEDTGDDDGADTANESAEGKAKGRKKA